MPRLFLSDLHRMTREISSYLEQEVSRPNGLITLEAHLLTYLAGYAPCPVSQISSVFGIKRSTLTGILDRLERRGFIQRTLNPDDRRSFLIELRPEGASVAAAVNDGLDAFETRIAEAAGEDLLASVKQFSKLISEQTGSRRRPGIPD